jgi:transcriptional regulator with XRE-family HTH domain
VDVAGCTLNKSRERRSKPYLNLELCSESGVVDYQTIILLMPDPLSLNQQLAQRAKTFCSNLGLAQNRLARLLKVDESQWSRFLNGQANLSSEKTLQLHRLLSFSRRDLELKFGSPEKLTARLMHLQVKGQPMKLGNDGWVAGTGPDQNDGDITSVSSVNGGPSDDQLTDVLRQVGNLHRQALDILNDYTSKIQKARPNANGTTEPARRINDNTASQTPGPRPDRFSR